MNIIVAVGVQGHQTKIIEKKDTANHYGSGSAEVFATPALIALMEKTAFESIEPLLPAGFSSVGIEINVQHLKASLPGAIITCISEVTQVEGKKIYFSISASSDDGVVGKASHIRYIINSAEFINRLKQ